jgi:hypothetical protein
MNRRKVTAALAALLGVAGLATNELLAGRETAAGAETLARKLADLLQLDERSVACMCTARARAQLVSHFDRCSEQIAQLQRAADPAALKRTLREQIEADYLRGDIVDVDGWQLASTEALVIAAYALSSAPA